MSYDKRDKELMDATACHVRALQGREVSGVGLPERQTRSPVVSSQPGMELAKRLNDKADNIQRALAAGDKELKEIEGKLSDQGFFQMIWQTATGANSRSRDRMLALMAGNHAAVAELVALQNQSMKAIWPVLVNHDEYVMDHEARLRALERPLAAIPLAVETPTLLNTVVDDLGRMKAEIPEFDRRLGAAIAKAIKNVDDTTKGLLRQIEMRVTQLHDDVTNTATRLTDAQGALGAIESAQAQAAIQMHDQQEDLATAKDELRERIQRVESDRKQLSDALDDTRTETRRLALAHNQLAESNISLEKQAADAETRVTREMMRIHGQLGVSISEIARRQSREMKWIETNLTWLQKGAIRRFVLRILGRAPDLSRRRPDSKL